MKALASIAVVAVVAYVAIHFVFGIAGGIIGLLLGLAWFLLKAMLVVGVVYFILTIVSPETAKKMRDFGGPRENL